MDVIALLLLTQKFFIALFGLSIGYHMAQAFRDIETRLGETGFIKWFREAVKQATHHYDIGLAGMITGISIYLWTSPFTRINIALFVFFMFLAAYWDDRADAPPQELIIFTVRKMWRILLWKK
jgi:hypothetical protein